MKKLLVSLVIALVSSVGFAQQEWKPTQPIRVLIGQSPGSGNEVVFRKVAQLVTDRTGANFVVENYPGLDGALAWNTLGARPNDGYHITVQAMETSLVALPIQYPRQLTTDPRQAILVTPLASTPEIFAVGKDSPIKTFDDLRHAYQTKKLNVGISGSGAVLAQGMFMRDAKGNAELVQSVPYKSIPTNLTDLIGGSLDVSVVPAAGARQLAEGGKIRVIAAADSNPLPTKLPIKLIKDVYPGFEAKVTYAVFLPQGTPAEVVNWYVNAFAPAIKDPGVREWLFDAWTVPFPNPSLEASSRAADAMRKNLTPIATKTIKTVSE
jgi:tripartite-type tricarboxylate transporter receptor subunit TctC